MQTVDVLTDPGLDSKAFDGRGDGERQMPEGSDRGSGVVEDQPPIEEQAANGVGWGRSRGFGPQGEDWGPVRSSTAPVTLAGVERSDVHGVNAIVWWLMGCGRVSVSFEMRGFEIFYCRLLGYSSGVPSEDKSHGGRLVAFLVHFALNLSR